MVTVPQENTIAFNEPILILPSSVCNLFISPHTYIYCRNTHSHALHMGRHLANHSTELRRSSLNSVHLAPESSHNIPDQWRASIFLKNKLPATFQSHLTVVSNTIKTAADYTCYCES
ncbi:hypothetical protein PAMP_008078 [Pampus punctatissimus]